jgi:hypothetical protein
MKTLDEAFKVLLMSPNSLRDGIYYLEQVNMNSMAADLKALPESDTYLRMVIGAFLPIMLADPKSGIKSIAGTALCGGIRVGQEMEKWEDTDAAKLRDALEVCKMARDFLQYSPSLAKNHPRWVGVFTELLDRVLGPVPECDKVYPEFTQKPRKPRAPRKKAE